MSSVDDRLEELQRTAPEPENGILPATDYAVENCRAFFNIIGEDNDFGIFADIDHPGGVYVEWFPRTHAVSISFLPEEDDEIGDAEMFMVRL